MARLEFLNYLIVVYFIWAFHSYLIFMFFDESEKHYFWFVLNCCWLKDNYDSIDMFAEGLIEACQPWFG